MLSSGCGRGRLPLHALGAWGGSFCLFQPWWARGPRTCGHSGLCPILMWSANSSCSSFMIAEGPSG